MSSDLSLEKSKTFCILPWVHLAINSTGYLRLCCNSTPGKNIVLDEKNNKIHINKLTNINELKNNPWLSNIRKKMVDGDRLDICKRCYREEDSGVKSSRQGWNNKFSEHIPAAVDNTNSDGTTDFIKAEYIDLRLGNLCNLKCRMCNPYASKKWLEDWNKIQEQKLPQKEVQRLEKVDWFKDDITWDLLSKLSKSTKEIYFTGGEPFLIHQHKKLIDYLIENNFSSKIKLKYNTNLTILPEKLLSSWPNFKRVTVNISLDGTDSLNDYIRHPSCWDDIKFNLKKLHDFTAKNKNIYVNIHTTAQAYNANKICDLFEFLLDFPNFNRTPYINILNHPKYLNARILPIKEKNNIKNNITTWIEKHKHLYFTEQDNINLNKLSGFVNYILKEDWSDQISEFNNYTKKLDDLRDEKLKHINNDIYQATHLQ